MVVLKNVQARSLSRFRMPGYWPRPALVVVGFGLLVLLTRMGYLQIMRQY